MSQHARLRIDTGLEIYFCDPQSPWQRGTNENTNGLLRQYFPKGTDLARHGPEDFAAVADALNSRPRKTLGWRTRRSARRAPRRSKLNPARRRHQHQRARAPGRRTARVAIAAPARPPASLRDDSHANFASNPELAHRYGSPTKNPVLRRPVESGQFVSLAFGQQARATGIAQSMGSRGDYFDNAAESFFATLKKEIIHRRSWPARDELRTEVFDYIETFYGMS
jgi:hypothetical protein